MNKRTFTLDIPEIRQIPSFMKILDDLSVGNNVFLVGSKGTGKSRLQEQVSYSFFGRRRNDKKELPFEIINCNQWTSPVDIIGGQTLDGYQEGALSKAWGEGKILLLDELPKLDPNTAGILNYALAKTADTNAIILNGQKKPIRKHPDFGCIASGNTLGKAVSHSYVGNNKQDSSLLDRFSGSIYRIGFNEALERQIVYPAVVNICIDIRNSILAYEGEGTMDQDTEDIVTLRTMINMQRIYELEMMREMGLKDANGTIHQTVTNGKTLKDCLESFFWTMSREKATRIKDEVGYENFINSYKGSVWKDQFIQEYKRRR